MQRTASAIGIFGGAAFLLAWLVSPASSAPSAVTRPPAFLFDAAALAEINAQVTRLNERLSQNTNYPEPVRDPFRFGRSIERPDAVAPPSADVVPAPSPPPALPTLVAILAAPGDGLPQRSAVFEEGGGVRIVTVGESVAGLTISAITDDAVTLLDSASGTARQLSLN